MDVETVGKTIQLILAPVVMVSACAITLGGLLARYAAINDRLRAMAKERLDLLRAAGGELATAVARCDAFARERLEEIDAQAPELLRRHKRVRDAVLAAYVAILVFILCMFTIALAAATGAAWAATATLVLFLGGVATLMLGAALTVLEVRSSHRALHYETERVLALGRAPR